MQFSAVRRREHGFIAGKICLFFKRAAFLQRVFIHAAARAFFGAGTDIYRLHHDFTS